VLERYLPVAFLSFAITASASAPCPDAAALSFFKHQIAYERTQKLNPFRGFHELHADVWQRGRLTAFYIRDRLADFTPGVRMTYLFGRDGMQGGETCAAKKPWRVCIEKFARGNAADVVGTCTATLDVAAIPAWRPSPNGPTSRNPHRLR
jgi:hypothetical protein